jgi:hypothetical protein
MTQQNVNRDKPAFHEELTCDSCGRFGAHFFDSKKLCVDCYQACGSCCSEGDNAEPCPAVNPGES